MQAENGHKKAERVLAVEDDALVLMMAVEMLGDLGYEAREAASADEALAVLQTEPIDILFTDVGLGGKTGVQLAIEAKQQFPQLRLIFATGHSVVKEMDTYEELRHAVLLMKPFDEAELEQALKAAKLRAGQPDTAGGAQR